MSQKHVDLLMNSLKVEDELSKYLCDKIHFTCVDTRKTRVDLLEIINKWLEKNGGYDPTCEYVKYSFEYTPLFNEEGMTREEWAETILAPLALELEGN